MLQKLPLVTCSRTFIKLNVGLQLFRRLSTDSSDFLYGSNFINSYLQLPLALENFSFINLAQQWSYNKARKNEKWKKITITTIVHVWPRFPSIPSEYSDSYVDFCWSELILYKPFHSFNKNIGLTKTTIIQNSEPIRNTYHAWHVDCIPPPTSDETTYEDEDTNIYLDN